MLGEIQKTNRPVLKGAVIDDNDGGWPPATWKRIEKEAWVQHARRPWLGTLRAHWCTPEYVACEVHPDELLLVFRRKYMTNAIRPFNHNIRKPCEWVDPPVFLWEDLTEK